MPVVCLLLWRVLPVPVLYKPYQGSATVPRRLPSCTEEREDRRLELLVFEELLQPFTDVR